MKSSFANTLTRNRKSLRSDTTKQISLEAFPEQPDTRYKVFCNDCDFEYFSNRLAEAKFQSLNHDEKNSHYSEIEFLKGVSVF